MKLTPQQLAALAAGMSMDDVLASASSEGTTADDQGAATAEQAQAALFAQNEQLVALTAEVETLKADKVETDTKLAEAATALESALAEQATLKATAEAMSSTILGRVKNMSIALNLTAPDSADDIPALVALHTDLDAKMQEKFKAGRVSASTSKTEEKKKPSWSQAHLAAASKIRVY